MASTGRLTHATYSLVISILFPLTSDCCSKIGSDSPPLFVLLWRTVGEVYIEPDFLCRNGSAENPLQPFVVTNMGVNYRSQLTYRHCESEILGITGDTYFERDARAPHF